MGYMGFGMRKEVYTRKPKKVFKRARKTSIPVPSEASQAGYDASEAYQAIRFKPIRERKWFKLIVLITTLGLFWLVLDFLVLDDLVYRFEVRNFEKKGVEGFYQEERSALDSLIYFMEKREGKIARLSTPYRVSLRVRSENYFDSLKDRSVRAHHQGVDYYEGTKQFEIVDGNLKFKYHDFYRVYKEYWSCDLDLRKASDIPSSLLNHLQTDTLEFQHIFQMVDRYDLMVRTFKHGTVLSFTKFRKPYALVATDSISLLQERTDQTFHRIETGLYSLNAEIPDETLVYK